MIADWKLLCAKVAMAIGFGGFAVCWMIVWNTEQRVFSDPAYAQKTDSRSVPITAEGNMYYLEPVYASHYNAVMSGIVPFMAIGGLGGAYFEFRRRNSK